MQTFTNIWIIIIISLPLRASIECQVEEAKFTVFKPVRHLIKRQNKQKKTASIQ